MVRYFGAHVSVSGGLENAIANASTLGVNAIQLHPSPPQRWNTKPYPPGYEDAFMKARETSAVERVFFHAIYLINLATPDPEKLEKAKNSLKYYLDLNARLNGDGVVVHVGSLKDEPDEARGFQRVADAIHEILQESDERSRLILEVAAGAGKIIGDELEELREIADLVKNPSRLGFGLDTQHMWASGYDWRDELDVVFQQIESCFSFSQVWCVHLNDSKTELGSRKDRHENLGQGLIGEEALQAFLGREEIAEIPLILETPALKDIETAKAEVDHLRAMIHKSR